MDNLQLWRSVEKTDPDMTKRVEVGRKFTAIDAHYQVMRATEMFGPAGAGWGTRNERFDTIVCDPADPHFTLLKYQAVLWFNYIDQAGTAIKGELEIAADIELFTNTKSGWKRMDDPVKKVRTDALTKGLSWLGFNADVFMGKFDNNKYVQQLQQEKRQQAQQPALVKQPPPKPPAPAAPTATQAPAAEDDNEPRPWDQQPLPAAKNQRDQINKVRKLLRMNSAAFLSWLESYDYVWETLTDDQAKDAIKMLDELLDQQAADEQARNQELSQQYDRDQAAGKVPA